MSLEQGKKNFLVKNVIKYFKTVKTVKEAVLAIRFWRRFNYIQFEVFQHRQEFYLTGDQPVNTELVLNAMTIFARFAYIQCFLYCISTPGILYHHSTNEKKMFFTLKFINFPFSKYWYYLVIVSLINGTRYWKTVHCTTQFYILSSVSIQ